MKTVNSSQMLDAKNEPAHVEPPDIIDIDITGHLDQIDLDEGIPVAAEGGDQVGGKLVTGAPASEAADILDRVPEHSNNDADPETVEDGSPMQGYDDDILTGQRRSRRIAVKQSLHSNDQNSHSYYVRDTYEDIAHLAGQIKGGSRRRSWRATKTIIERRTLHAYKLSVKKASMKNEKASKESITKELKQLVDKGVWEVIEKVHLTKNQLKSVIRSSMFLKEKFNGDGSFDKLKARLVAGGDGQDKSLYDNLSSPTVAQETVMMVIAIAAAEKRKVLTLQQHI
jgi:hypothetical protein